MLQQMKQRFNALIVSLILVFACFSFSSLKAEIHASVYVPLEDPVYDFIEQCISRDILPVWSVTAKPVSRRTIGRLLMKTASHFHELDDQILKADLNYYLRQFAEDIKSDKGSADDKLGVRTLRSAKYSPQWALDKPHWHAVSFSKKQFRFTFDPLIDAAFDMGEDTEIFRRSHGIQFRGAFRDRIGFYFRFRDHVERGNGPYKKRDQLLVDRWGYVGPLLGGNETYYDITDAYLTFGFSGMEFLLGKDKVAWGSSDTDGLLLSGSAPSYSQFRLKTELFEKVRFTYVIGSLHAWEAPVDTLYKTDNDWTRIRRAEKWLAAHRLEYMPWNWLVLAVNESVIWGDRGLDFSYLNPLNLYYSAEHDGGDQDNVLWSGDLTLRIRGYGLLYGELLIDDLSLSTLGEGNPGNKLGIIAGGKLLQTGVDGLTSGIEYIRLEPYVYTHFFAVNRYTTWTSKLGANIAANSDRLRWWMRYRPLRNLEFNTKVDLSRSGSVGSDPDDSIERDHSGTVYFLDGNPQSWVNTDISLMWEPMTKFTIRTGWIDGDRRSIVRNRFYIEAGYRL